MTNDSSFVIDLNDLPMRVRAGTTVAAAILEAGSASRLSVRGDRRQPLCGMGICYECRAWIDGQAHQRTCQIVCRPGMRVVAG
jgi:sarcosine oxidase subunit alpha